MLRTTALVHEAYLQLIKLPRYWTDTDANFAFLIKCGGQVAGFALATRGSPATQDATDLDVAEFFILRGYRRSGIGRCAAAPLSGHAIPCRYQGCAGTAASVNNTDEEQGRQSGAVGGGNNQRSHSISHPLAAVAAAAAAPLCRPLSLFQRL